MLSFFKTGTPKKKHNQDSQSIDDYLNLTKEITKYTVQMLLLGPGGSGKSTILKQMHKVYDGTVPINRLKQAVISIKHNILQDILDIMQQNLKMRKTNAQCVLKLPNSEQVMTQLLTMFENNSLTSIKLTPAVAKSIQTVWADPGIQQTYHIRKKSQIMDNTPYFFEHAVRIAQPKYAVTFDDFVRVRVRTTGIMESTFDVNVENEKQKMEQQQKQQQQEHEQKNSSSSESTMNGNAGAANTLSIKHNKSNSRKGLIVAKDSPTDKKDDTHNRQKSTSNVAANFDFRIGSMYRLNVTDVGGQRTERKKWVKCFGDLDVILFVMSIAGYDQVLYEDHSTNCLDEAFTVFQKTFAQPCLHKVDVVVFLNKHDLFLEKIKTIPFTVYDSTFDKQIARDAAAVIKFIKSQLEMKYHLNQTIHEMDKELNFHVTCATDTTQMTHVMNVIKFEQISKSMKNTSLD